MARLNLTHARWLTFDGASRDADGLCESGRAARAATPEYSDAVARLRQVASGLPPLFARARVKCGGGSGNGAAATVEVLECERMDRREALVPLARLLRTCEETLDGCRGELPAVLRGRFADALRTLETEYVRLCDAQRFYFERRLKELRTGEEDDDPEFTAVLKCVMYATDEGDDVEASIAQAVQEIDASLARRGGTRARRRPPNSGT